MADALYFCQEKFIPGLAHALVDLFSIPLPDAIGVFRGVSSDGIPVIGPFREEDAPVDVPALLERLFVLSTRLVAHLDPSLLRICLVHIDPHNRKVVHDSEFCGLVDRQVSVVRILLFRD